MRVHFTTLVKHPKKVFQGLFPRAVGGMRSLPWVARCWVAVSFPVASCAGTLGGSRPHPSDVPATGCFHGRDPRAPP